jgi:hypothetical protein
MNSLARSTNPQTISLVTEDFKSLKIDMPMVKKVSEEEECAPKEEKRKAKFGSKKPEKDKLI